MKFTEGQQVLITGDYSKLDKKRRDEWVIGDPIPGVVAGTEGRYVHVMVDEKYRWECLPTELRAV